MDIAKYRGDTDIDTYDTALVLHCHIGVEMLIETYGCIWIQINQQREIQIDRQIDGWMDREKESKVKLQIDRQIERQVDR